MRLGIVERHYLLCPFCGNRASLVDHRCSGCGAKAEYVVWSSGSPELALVGQKRSLHQELKDTAEQTRIMHKLFPFTRTSSGHG